MIVYGNHAGFNALDALLLMVAVRRHAKCGRPRRLLQHVGIEKEPLIGYFMQQRLGAVIGHPADAQYILGKGGAVLSAITCPRSHLQGRPIAVSSRPAECRDLAAEHTRPAAESFPFPYRNPPNAFISESARLGFWRPAPALNARANLHKSTLRRWSAAWRSNDANDHG